VQYALSNGVKKRPSRGLCGVCPSCGRPVIPKCGTVRVHHWAHVDGRDCDPWAESLTEWHIAWQRGLQPEATEVVMPPHRADIVGNGSTVIELQHSPISTEDITARELFYGDMVWLFDATERFRFIKSGDCALFSLGRNEKTSPILDCKKPVFFDFGDSIIEVEAFTRHLDRLAGYGICRTRDWFRARFLDSVIAAPQIPPPPGRAQILFSHWEGKHCPYRRMEHPTRWRATTTESEHLLPAGEPYVPLEYIWKLSDGTRVAASAYVAKEMPQLANGWTALDVEKIRTWLSGRRVIIGGLMRVIPQHVASLEPFAASESMSEVIAQLSSHIAAGRVPVLKPVTLETISGLVRPEGWMPHGRAWRRPWGRR
jgi:hypothetical protein